MKFRTNTPAAVFAAVSATFLGAASAQADVLAQFTFETTPPTLATGNLADAGVFAATSTASTNSGGTISNPVGNGSAESFSSNGFNSGEFYQFATQSTGFEDITVSYAQAASNTGPRDFQFSFSTDGTVFTPFGAVYVGPTADFISATTARPENVLTQDLSGIDSLDDQDAIFFRITVASDVAENGGTLASTGTFRVDDFTINGDLIPEPTGLAVLGLSGLALVRRRRA